MRNFIAGLSGGSGAFAAAGLCAVLVAAGYWVQTNRNAADEATQLAALPVEGTAPTDAPEVEEAVTEAPETAETETAPEPVAPFVTPPAFDEVRREADGMTVIAGRAMPGAEVAILKDGELVAEGTADASGKFASLALIPPDGAGHVLTLLQRFEGQELLSDDEIILAPTAPVVVAEAPPEETPEPPVEQTPVPETTAVAEPAPVSSTTSPEPEQAETVPEPEEAATIETAQAAPTEDETPQVAQIEQDAPVPQVEVASPEPEAVAEVDPLANSVAPEVSTAGVDVQSPQLGQTGIAQIQTDLGGTGVPRTQAPQSVDAPSQDTVIAALKPAPRPLPKAEPEPAPLDPEPQAAEAAVVEPAAETQAPAPEPATVAVLKSTADGVELLNTPSPEAMTNVAIDTISYSDTGDVQLAGRAQTDTTSVRVYLDNNSVVNLPVDAQGRWRGELPDVDQGVYTLRVDEVSVTGQVTSRVETPFKREDAEVLAAAAAAQDGPIKAITVQKGATLWAIARERYGDGELYVRVVEANSALIRNPDLIYPGQIFDLPD